MLVVEGPGDAGYFMSPGLLVTVGAQAQATADGERLYAKLGTGDPHVLYR